MAGLMMTKSRKDKKRAMRIICVPLFLVLFAVSMAGTAFAKRSDDDNIRGRFAIGHYNVNDTASAGDVNVTHVYYRLIVDDLFDNEDVSLNIDGRGRSSGADYRSDIPSNRLILANVEIKNIFNFMQVTIGRSYIEEFTSEQVDGIDAKLFWDKRTGIGLYGGARPDPYEDTVNTDFTVMGSYLFTRQDSYGATAGYSLNSFKGKKDRERAGASFYIMPDPQKLTFQASVDFDNDFDAVQAEGGASGWEITNLLVHGNFRPTRWFLLTATYTQFRAINREASFEHIIGEDLFTEEYYSILRVSTEIRPTKTIGVYAGGDSRNREFDQKSAQQFYIGVKDSDSIFGMRWDIRYSDLSWFTSKVKSIYVSVGYSLNSFDFDASVTRMNNSQEDLDNDLEQMVYELNGNWWITKQIYATLAWSYSSEKYLDIDSIYSSRFADNFATTTLYAQVGYRF